MGVIGRICRLGPLLTRKQVEVFCQHGLDFASFDVLATLRRSEPPHELTPSQLAQRMIVTPGAVAQRLTRLEEQGLVTRAHSENDRRVVTVSLTESGHELIDRALPHHLDNEQRILAEFDQSELETLASLLRRLLVAQGDLPASQRSE